MISVIASSEALKPSFKEYQENVIKNYKKLADEMVKKGFDLVSGGTDNHLILVDLQKFKITGKQMEQYLDKIGGAEK